MPGMRSLLSLLSLFGAGVLAVFGGAAARAADGDPPTIVATEYAYTGVAPEHPRGTARFAFRNDGEVTHEAILVRVNLGHTLREALDAQLESRAAKVLGFTYAKAGKTGRPLRAKLTPGRYAVICMIPDAKKRPHWSRGQVARFRVR